MIAEFPKLEDLPRQSASDVKNKWREVVREVRESGSVAITSHSSVEMVLVNADAYRQLVASAAAVKATRGLQTAAAPAFPGFPAAQRAAC